MPRFLFVLLEGTDDERFFNRVLKSELAKKYDKIVTYLYAERPKKAIESMLNSLKRADSEYVIFADFDTSQCITESKTILKNKIPGAGFAKIAVAKKEIESWYLAGLDRASTRKLRIPFYPNTEGISKEMFEHNRLGKHDSRIDFMQEILKRFDVKVAKKQNDSFRYVWHKFVF